MPLMASRGRQSDLIKLKVHCTLLSCNVLFRVILFCKLLDNIKEK